MHSKLAIIGFDAQLDGLDNVDRVAAAFYKGNVHSAAVKLAQCYDYSDLCKLSASRVVKANLLTGQQVAVINVCDAQQSIAGAKQAHIRCDTVASLADALTLSAQIINDLDVAVLIIAANLASQPENPQQHAIISFDRSFSGYGQNAGVACVLLASENFAAVHNSYIYGYLKGCSVADDVSQIGQTITQSFVESGLSSDAISSVEVSAPAEQRLKEEEQKALLKSYQNGLTLHSAVCCVKSVAGENGPLSELLGLLNAVFALQQRYRAAIKDWSAPQNTLLADWTDSPFYLLNESAPAFPKNDGAPRYIAYSCLSAGKNADSQYAHIILEENNDKQVHSNGFNASADLSLFILVGDSQVQLTAQLAQLNNDLHSSDFKASAKSCYQHYLQNSAARYCAVLLAESSAQLSKEIALALSGIPDAFANSKDWKTPQGSYFCVNSPAEHKISFLYPGIGATYLGLGRDLLHLFPEIYPGVLALADDIEASLKDELLTPRTVVRLDFQDLKQRDLALRTNLANIAECGVGYACVFTKIFADVLNINADFAAGYSMGEVSMFAALGCWGNPGQMSARLANSKTFSEQLSGELKTLRTLWDLPPSAQGGEKLLWESYNIKGSVQQVENAILENERVYITLINTPQSLVIAGYPADCLAVAKRLAVRAMPLNVHNAIHCEPACQQYQQMVDLYSMDLAQRNPTKLYSSSCYLPVPFTKKAIAVSIAKCLSEQVDFPRLINTLVEQGTSLFIEMGAGCSLSTWTDKILQSSGAQRNCMTVAVNSKGTEQQLMIARAMAKLVSFGVKVNLSSFFNGSLVVQVNSKNKNTYG